MENVLIIFHQFLECKAAKSMDQFQLTVQKALWIHVHSLQSFEVHFSSYVFRHLKIMDTQMDKLKGQFFSSSFFA